MIVLKHLKKIYRNTFNKTVTEYPYEVKRFELATEGVINYAQWLHPKETLKTVTQEQINSLREYINEGDLVIDVGAHTGDTTIPMALAAGKSGLTLALEPNTYVFKLLEKNASRNPHNTNIKDLNYAAIKHNGEFIFDYSDEAYCNGGYLSQISSKKRDHIYHLKVKGMNLSNYLHENYKNYLDKLSYLKIDTEGYDKEVIASMIDIIKIYKPVIQTEVLKKLTQHEREELYQLLMDAGYRCYKYGSDEQPKGQLIAKNDLLRWKHFDILALPVDAIPLT